MSVTVSLPTTLQSCHSHFEQQQSYFYPQQHYIIQEIFNIYLNGAVNIRTYAYTSRNVFVTIFVDRARSTLSLQTKQIYKYHFVHSTYICIYTFVHLFRDSMGNTDRGQAICRQLNMKLVWSYTSLRPGFFE